MTGLPDRTELLLRQLKVTWSFAEEVLVDVTPDEALWTPSPESWTVRDIDGRWAADWVEPEPWPLPPTSLAWVQWHVMWWWSTVLDRCTGDGELQRADVTWQGPEDSMVVMRALHDTWIAFLSSLTDDDLSSNELTRWPYTDGRPFAFVAGWVNVELMKNVAEMAMLRRSTPFFAGGRFAAQPLPS
jgi:hypothetical protein